MPLTLKRLLRSLIRKRRETRPLQNVLDTPVYDLQYSPSIDNLTIDLEATSLEPPTTSVEPPTTPLETSMTSLEPSTTSLEPPMTSIEAPIHRLPAEVLGLMFVYTLDPLCDRRQSTPEVNDPPIVLCGVCKWWRDVAISMPMLWSTFDAFAIGKTTNMALYRLWLKRTRGAPLAIGFDAFHVEEFETALTLFFSHSYQWANVTITLQPLIYAKLLELRPDNVPLLRRVHIAESYDLDITKNDAYKLISILSQIPSLSDLSWDFDIPTPFSTLMWPNLRKFATSVRLHTGECLALLACLPQIEDVVIGRYVHSPIGVTSAITVKNLCSLSVRSYWLVDDPAEFFNALTLPSLKALQSPIPEDCSSIERLLDRSCCTLHHLGIDEMHRQGRLLGYSELKCFRSICSLRLTSRITVTDDLAGRLTWNPENDFPAQVFPYLSTISLEVFDTTDGVVSRMISSRWKGSHHPHGLKCVELPWYFLDSKKHRHIDLATLRSLREQGLEVVRTISIY